MKKLLIVVLLLFLGCEDRVYHLQMIKYLDLGNFICIKHNDLLYVKKEVDHDNLTKIVCLDGTVFVKDHRDFWVIKKCGGKYCKGE